MIRRFSDAIRQLRTSKGIAVVPTLALLSIYIAYIAFVIRANQGPVDYETFMRIGRALLEGGELYGENSYYPLPYVGVFALFSLLPRPLSMAIWLGGPVLVALAVDRFRPSALLFAPVFSHFAGGQSSVFALLGFFVYRRKLDPSSTLGGVFLALTALKPQLAIVPVGYALVVWIRAFRETRQVPRQSLSFLLTVGLIYLPAFILRPAWLLEWLSVPRPLFGRALSGAVPRFLLFLRSPDDPFYWVAWALLGLVVLGVTWKIKGNSHPLDILLLASFVVSPLVHDYDLIQVLPTIWGPWMPMASVVLSLPGWWAIATSYGNDAAWATFAIIAPGLLITYIYQCRRRGESDVDCPTRCCHGPG